MAQWSAVANNPGSSLSAQSCEPRFVRALIRDVFVLTHFASHELSKLDMASIDQMLPEDISLLAENLQEVMNQCCRLKAGPELFPSIAMKDDFMKEMAKASPLMVIMAEIIQKKYKPENDCTVSKDNMESLSNDTDVRSKESAAAAEWPEFHPDRPNAKNPWNNWLDNSSVRSRKWVAIQQKIPRIGDKLMRRITLEYDAIERSFAVVCLPNW
jgi:hypothetical protein